MERVLEPEYMDTPEEADGYDSMDHSESNQTYIDRLLELGFFGRTLDIGTGPGHIPLLLLDNSDLIAEIVGVDAALRMLAHANRHRLDSPHAERVSFQVEDAKALSFADASFDCVYSNTVMHHIPDPVPYLKEAFRVLKPGGAFLVRDLFRPPTPGEAMKIVDLHAAGDTDYQRKLFYDSLCAALTRGEFEEAAQQAGIEGHEIVIDSDRHMSLQIRADKPDA